MTRALDPVMAAVEARIPPRRRRAVIPQTIRCLWPATATGGSRPATAGAVREADSPLIGPHPHRVRRGLPKAPARALWDNARSSTAAPGLPITCVPTQRDRGSPRYVLLGKLLRGADGPCAFGAPKATTTVGQRRSESPILLQAHRLTLASPAAGPKLEHAGERRSAIHTTPALVKTPAG